MVTAIPTRDQSGARRAARHSGFKRAWPSLSALPGSFSLPVEQCSTISGMPGAQESPPSLPEDSDHTTVSSSMTLLDAYTRLALNANSASFSFDNFDKNVNILSTVIAFSRIS